MANKCKSLEDILINSDINSILSFNRKTGIFLISTGNGHNDDFKGGLGGFDIMFFDFFVYVQFGYINFLCFFFVMYLFRV